MRNIRNRAALHSMPTLHAASTAAPLRFDRRVENGENATPLHLHSDAQPRPARARPVTRCGHPAPVRRPDDGLDGYCRESLLYQ